MMMPHFSFGNGRWVTLRLLLPVFAVLLFGSSTKSAEGVNSSSSSSANRSSLGHHPRQQGSFNYTKATRRARRRKETSGLGRSVSSLFSPRSEFHHHDKFNHQHRHLGNLEVAKGSPPATGHVILSDESNSTTATSYRYVDANLTHSRPWVRGVNLGGWLMLERFITPYQFAITDCHVQGDLCWYPGQVSAPPIHQTGKKKHPNQHRRQRRTLKQDGRGGQNQTLITNDDHDDESNNDDDEYNYDDEYDEDEYKLCDLYKCTPLRTLNTFGILDYPMDEYTLAAAFATTSSPPLTKKNVSHSHDNDDEAVRRRTTAGSRWFNTHFENFVTRRDLETLVDHGVTHVRVPLPHWILGSVLPDEPWMVADRWYYFERLLQWSRELDLQVWPDIHTAPGSQNGFDNSGQAKLAISCVDWSNSPAHVERSLQVIRDVTTKILQRGYQDVVTGFGLLNEPFKDCNRNVYETFIQQGLQIVRDTLGPDTAVYVSDMFLAKTFNNGWWNDPKAYHNTYLDSHYYHVFAEEPRALSPRQHIAYVCQNEGRDATSCCYHDYPNKTQPAAGVSRMVGEWSAAVDTLPVAMLQEVMDGIAATGLAPHFDRKLTSARQDFLLHFVQAQMVTYEAAERGSANAWFYWTLKMEGGAFAEWDFLRGLSEGWIPSIPPPNTTSQSLFGSCYEIIFKTNDSMAVIHEYPDPATLPKNNWQGVDIDDQVVLSHGDSFIHPDQYSPPPPVNNNPNSNNNRPPIAPVHHGQVWLRWFLVMLTVCAFCLIVVRFVWRRRSKQHEYSQIGNGDAEQYHDSNHLSV